MGTATTAPVAAGSAAAVSRVPRGPARPPRQPGAQIDPEKAGLQLMQAPSRGPAEKRSADEAAAMPPPMAPKERKVYVAARPPPRSATDARDADMEDSGETADVQG